MSQFADDAEYLDYLEDEHALCVRSSYTISDEPTRVTLWWPIWRGSKSNAECYALGHKLIGRDGRYGYAYDPELPEAAKRTIFLLEDGGRTQAIKVVQEPVATPKVRAGIETRYQSGHWQKYLKTQGWVRA